MRRSFFEFWVSADLCETGIVVVGAAPIFDKDGNDITRGAYCLGVTLHPVTLDEAVAWGHELWQDSMRADRLLNAYWERCEEEEEEDTGLTGAVSKAFDKFYADNLGNWDNMNPVQYFKGGWEAAKRRTRKKTKQRR